MERKERALPPPSEVHGKPNNKFVTERAQELASASVPSVSETNNLSAFQAEVSAAETGNSDVDFAKDIQEHSELSHSKTTPASELVLDPVANTQSEVAFRSEQKSGLEAGFQPEIATDFVPEALPESIESSPLEKEVVVDTEEQELIEGVLPNSILGDPREDEDLLDIPAFLRRQAN